MTFSFCQPTAHTPGKFGKMGAVNVNKRAPVRVFFEVFSKSKQENYLRGGAWEVAEKLAHLFNVRFSPSDRRRSQPPRQLAHCLDKSITMRSSKIIVVWARESIDTVATLARLKQKKGQEDCDFGRSYTSSPGADPNCGAAARLRL